MDRERAEMIWELMDSADMYTSYIRFCEDNNITYIQPNGEITIGLMTALMEIYDNNLAIQTINRPLEKMVEVKKELLHRDTNTENIAGIYS